MNETKKRGLIDNFSDLVGNNWRSLGGLTLLFSIATILFDSASAPIMNQLEGLQNTNDPQLLMDVLASHGPTSIIVSLFYFILTAFYYASINTISYRYLSNAENREEWLAASIRKTPVIFISYFIFIISLFIGIILLIIPGLIILFGALFASMQIVADGKGPLGGLIASIKMSIKNIGKTCFTWAMVFVISISLVIMQMLAATVLNDELALYVIGVLKPISTLGIALLISVIYMDIKANIPNTEKIEE
jgi:hypothetical protein